MNNKLIQAFEIISSYPFLREEVIKFCKNMEKKIPWDGRDIREIVSGPILDSIFNEKDIIRKKVASGLVFDFYYRTKIARDFIMSDEDEPDHVWEPQTTKLLLHLSSGAKNILVGGAYFGDQVLFIANKIKDSGICHAFEANGDQIKMLLHNADLNCLSNIVSVQKGLWNESGRHLVLSDDDSFAFATLKDSNDGIETITVDDYAIANKISNFDLIMLDIEGSELNVFKGALNQISLPQSAAPNLIFEVHRSYVDWSNGLKNAEIFVFLGEFGYNFYAVRDFNSNYPMGNKPVEIIPIDDVYLEGPPHGFNILAVKNPDIVKSDFFRICHNVSPKLLRHKDPSLHHPVDGL